MSNSAYAYVLLVADKGSDYYRIGIYSEFPLTEVDGTNDVQLVLSWTSAPSFDEAKKKILPFYREMRELFDCRDLLSDKVIMITLDTLTGDQLLALERMLNEAANGVTLIKDPTTGKLWFKWKRALTDIECARIRIVLAREGLLHIAKGLPMIPSRLIPLDPWDSECDTIINPAEIVSIQIDEHPQMVLGSRCFTGPRSLKAWDEWYARRSEDNEAKAKFARVTFRNQGGTYWVALSESETLKDLHMYLCEPITWSPRKA